MLREGLVASVPGVKTRRATATGRLALDGSEVSDPVEVWDALVAAGPSA